MATGEGLSVCHPSGMRSAFSPIFQLQGAVITGKLFKANLLDFILSPVWKIPVCPCRLSSEVSSEQVSVHNKVKRFSCFITFRCLLFLDVISVWTGLESQPILLRKAYTVPLRHACSLSPHRPSAFTRLHADCVHQTRPGKSSVSLKNKFISKKHRGLPKAWM